MLKIISAQLSQPNSGSNNINNPIGMSYYLHHVLSYKFMHVMM